MLIGHIAVALGFKKATPRTSLGTLLLAAQWSGLLWPVILIFGLEHLRIVPGIAAVNPGGTAPHPLTHSLLIDFGWALILAGIYLVFRKNRRGALMIWICVMSGWLLDFIVYRPELPVYPGSSELAGIGLWGSPATSLLIEGALFTAGVIIYSKATRAQDRIGEYAFRTFVALLVLIYLVAIMSTPYTNGSAVETAGLFGWILVAWAYWIDRHRTSGSPPPSPIE